MQDSKTVDVVVKDIVCVFDARVGPDRLLCLLYAALIQEDVCPSVSVWGDQVVSVS